MERLSWLAVTFVLTVGCEATVSGVTGDARQTADSDSPSPANGDPGAVDGDALDPGAAPPLRFAVSYEETALIGPFPSWANVKADYGAVGNGTTDDTAAIQAALDELGSEGHPYVLYFPAGTYRVTASLRYTASEWYNGAQLIGDAPGTTTIRWSGPEGGQMLIINGGVNTRLSRLTWDGRGKAGIGVAQWWNGVTNPDYYGGSVEHTDEVFVDMGIGVMGGRMDGAYGNLDSETQIRRVTFLRNSVAGVDLGSWNALDWWIWDSHFVDCARGATNLFSLDESGAGGFHIYRSLFERSTIADIHIANTQWFGIHDNVSIGSRRFFLADQIGANAASTILQGNRIVEPVESAAIVSGNVGPMILIDNVVRSRSDATGPVVRMQDDVDGSDVLSVGNSFTVEQPIQIVSPSWSVGGLSSRLMSFDDRKVSASTIASTPLELPSTPPWARGQSVFEVAAGSSAADIQAAIDLAAASDAAVPVVHVAPGTYAVDHTLVVPAGRAIHLSGDGLGSRLDCRACSADTPLLRLDGPSRATVRDLKMFFGDGPAIVVGNADQAGGRVFVVGSSFGGLVAEGLANTALEFQASPIVAAMTLTDVSSAVFIGNGGIGPASLTRSTVLWSDTWYEGREAALFRADGGAFTYIGGHMAPADPVHTDETAAVPAVELDGYRGTFTMLGASMNLAGVPSGVGIRVENENRDTRALFVCQATNTNFFEGSSASAGVGLLLSKGRATDGAVSLPDKGRGDADFVRAALTGTRSLDWHAVFRPQALATNVTLYRVTAVDSGPVALRVAR